MNTLRYGIFLLSLAAVAFAGCTKDGNEERIREQQNALMTRTELGVYRGDQTLYRFDEATSQINLNVRALRTRLQTDDLSGYVELRFDQRPVAGASVQATLRTRGVSGIANSTFPATVLKASGNTLWVWDDESGHGYILYWE